MVWYTIRIAKTCSDGYIFQHSQKTILPYPYSVDYVLYKFMEDHRILISLGMRLQNNWCFRGVLYNIYVDTRTFLFCLDLLLFTNTNINKSQNCWRLNENMLLQARRW